MTVHTGPKSGAGGVQLGFFRPEYHVRICGNASWPSREATNSGTPMCNTWARAAAFSGHWLYHVALHTVYAEGV